MVTWLRSVGLIALATGAWWTAPPLPRLHVGRPVEQPPVDVTPPAPAPLLGSARALLVVDSVPTDRSARAAFRAALRALPPGSAVVGVGRDGPMVLWSPAQGDVDAGRTPEPYAPGSADLDRFADAVATGWGLPVEHWPAAGGAR